MADEQDQVEGDEPDTEEVEDTEDQDAGDGEEGQEEEQTEGQEDEAGEGDEQSQDAQPKRHSAQERIRNQARLNREARERAEAAERRATEAEERAARIEREAQERRQRDEAEQERIALAQMTDAEKIQYQLAKQVKEIKDGQTRLAIQTVDATDQAKFEGFLAGQPKFAKYKAEVEKIHGQFMQRGQPMSRQEILKYVIGNKALSSPEPERQRQRGKARIESQRGRSGSVRSDTRGGSKGGTLVSRMEQDDPRI